MTDLSPVAVLVGAAAAFVVGAVYYMTLGARLSSALTASGARERQAAATMVVEAARSLMLAAVVAALVAGVGLVRWWEGAALGLLLFVGFPLVLWVGAVVHEGTPVRLAAVHAGDWLVKLVVVAAIAAALT